MFVDDLTKYIGKLTIVTIRLYGLWPHRFDGTVTGVILFTYSLAFSSASLILYYLYSPEIFLNISTELRSYALVIVEWFFTYLLAVMYITTYGGFYLNHKKIRRTLTRVASVYGWIVTSEFSYLPALLKFFAKWTVFDLVCSLTLIAGPFQQSTSSDANVFGAIAMSIPPVVIRAMPNLYYGCLVGGQCCYQNVNNRIELLRERIKTGVFTVDRFCNELDALSVDHLRLTKLINECNEICSLQVVLYVISLASGLLFQSTLYIVLLRRGSSEGFQVWSAIVFAMTMVDFYATFVSCNDILLEANFTLTLLQTILYEGADLDRRIRRSIKEFTMQITLKRLSLTGCGMLEFRLSTFHAAFATITSYAFILLQFELSSTYE